MSIGRAEKGQPRRQVTGAGPRTPTTTRRGPCFHLSLENYNLRADVRDGTPPPPVGGLRFSPPVSAGARRAAGGPKRRQRVARDQVRDRAGRRRRNEVAAGPTAAAGGRQGGAQADVQGPEGGTTTAQVRPETAKAQTEAQEALAAGFQWRRVRPGARQGHNDANRIRRAQGAGRPGDLTWCGKSTRDQPFSHTLPGRGHESHASVL